MATATIDSDFIPGDERGDQIYPRESTLFPAFYPSRPYLGSLRAMDCDGTRHFSLPDPPLQRLYFFGTWAANWQPLSCVCGDLGGVRLCGWGYPRWTSFRRFSGPSMMPATVGPGMGRACMFSHRSLPCTRVERDRATCSCIALHPAGCVALWTVDRAEMGSVGCLRAWNRGTCRSASRCMPDCLEVARQEGACPGAVLGPVHGLAPRGLVLGVD